MIGIYYGIIAIISALIYVLAEIFKGRKKRVGSIACYAILFIIALLFI